MRWSGTLVILAVVAVIALWPRESGGGDALAPWPAPNQDDAALAGARQRADLRPCPTRAPGRAVPGGPLAGVVAFCLGAPGSIDLGGALAGRTVLLNLWASWCQPCREEMPVLQSYADQEGAVPVIGVNVKDLPSEALDSAIFLGVRYPSVVDAGEAVQTALGVPQFLPLTYVLRPDGSVTRVTEPTVFRTPKQVRAAVERLGSD